MKLLVGYLATSGGADAVALAVRLARTLGAEVDICMVLPPTRAQPDAAFSAGYQDVLAEQAKQWLAEALALVPDGVRTTTHLMFDDAVAERLAAEAVRLEADAIVVGGAGGGLAGGYSLGSVVNDLLHS
ncbi:MAG: universal stress protein, partial [Mycobacterium sp.]|nr:universal stress protein [Mycobacterium sp.]